MAFEAKHGPLKRIKKRNLAPDERRINMIVGSREFRARKKAQGYHVYQCWVPDQIREDVKAVVKDMVKEWEEKHPLVRKP